MFVTSVMAKGPWAEKYTIVQLISSEQIAARSVINAVEDIVEAV
jgi:hypothetical protein